MTLTDQEYQTLTEAAKVGEMIEKLQYRTGGSVRITAYAHVTIAVVELRTLPDTAWQRFSGFGVLEALSAAVTAMEGK